MSAVTYGTSFLYGVKGTQLTGLVAETFDHDSEAKLRTELKNETGQLVGLRLDDVQQKLSISAVVSASGGVISPNTTITFAAQSSEAQSPGGIASKKYVVTKVKIAGKADDKLKLTIDAEAGEYLTIA